MEKLSDQDEIKEEPDQIIEKKEEAKNPIQEIKKLNYMEYRDVVYEKRFGTLIRKLDREQA